MASDFTRRASRGLVAREAVLKVDPLFKRANICAGTAHFIERQILQSVMMSRNKSQYYRLSNTFAKNRLN